VSADREPAPTLPGFLPDAGPLTLADHIPTPGAAGAALMAVAPEVVTLGPLREAVTALSEKLPHFERPDREAGA